MDLLTPFIKWLVDCPAIASNKLFLNAINVEDNAKQLVSSELNTKEDIEYIDGSILHKVTFTIFDFKSISFNQVLKSAIDRNENVEDLLDCGSICDWVVAEERSGERPDFGSNFVCEKVYPIYRTPSTPSIDNELGLAKYSIPIVCEVLEVPTRVISI